MSFIVGGIFHGDDDLTEMAFKYAIERVNNDQLNYELVPRIHRQGRQDSFKTQRIGKIEPFSVTNSIIFNLLILF